LNEKEARQKRQSEVSKAGKEKEREVIDILLSNEDISDRFLIGIPSKVLTNKSLLKIQYGEYQAEIDADICVVRKKDNKLVCVISVKKSFRERGGQTAYWALKVKQSGKDYKYILATPDVDKELFDENNPEKRRKWRIILPYECDSVFVYSYENKVYKEEKFFVGKDYLIEYIKSLDVS